MTALPKILTEGRTPADWAAEFADRGIEISERTLRAKARALGACFTIGKQMMLLPEHIDQIWEANAPCPSSSTQEEQSGGSKAGSTGSPVVNITGAAQDHLTKARHKKSSRRSKRGSSKVISLDPTRA